MVIKIDWRDSVFGFIFFSGIAAAEHLDPEIDAKEEPGASEN